MVNLKFITAVHIPKLRQELSTMEYLIFSIVFSIAYVNDLKWTKYFKEVNEKEVLELLLFIYSRDDQFIQNHYKLNQLLFKYFSMKFFSNNTSDEMTYKIDKRFINDFISDVDTNSLESIRTSFNKLSNIGILTIIENSENHIQYKINEESLYNWMVDEEAKENIEDLEFEKKRLEEKLEMEKEDHILSSIITDKNENKRIPNNMYLMDMKRTSFGIKEVDNKLNNLISYPFSKNIYFAGKVELLSSMIDHEYSLNQIFIFNYICEFLCDFNYGVCFLTNNEFAEYLGSSKTTSENAIRDINEDLIKINPQMIRVIDQPNRRIIERTEEFSSVLQDLIDENRKKLQQISQRYQ